MENFEDIEMIPQEETKEQPKAAPETSAEQDKRSDVLSKLGNFKPSPTFIDFEHKKPTSSELEDQLEFMSFTGQAIFSDIDGTITDNTGSMNIRAIEYIKSYMRAGGTFIPVTGRARFESVRSLVNTLGVPFIVINNGAEIFNSDGERIAGSELTDEEVRETFEIAAKHGLIWMQNKKNPETGEEWLFSNFTEESEQAMLDVGIVDTVHNEEGRVGLTAKHADSSEVMSIPGQNYKIQMMSPDPDAIQAAFDEFQAKGIPCMLNMQSSKDGRFHWVEVIRGTKIGGIQRLIDDFLPADITSASVVGDGGNDLTMFKDLHSRSGEPIVNTHTAVQNACQKLKDAADVILSSNFDKFKITDTEGRVEDTVLGGGASIYEMIHAQAELIATKRAAADLQRQIDFVEKLRSNTTDEEKIKQIWREWVADHPITPNKAA